MKSFATLAAAVSILCIAATTADAKDIKKQQQFMDTIVGKKLVSGGSWLVVEADGTIQGETAKKGKIKGAWVWNKRYFCRNVFVGTNQLPEDCQKVTIDGNQVTFTRDKGKGEAVPMTISN
ncbi:hypothetical protein [Ruegeria atlantica]|uniref:hypothetical protein n=1 Tax=Ruegeria atlantica TaxID=81569 RepID=UPI00147F2C3D|nr:hypothetical protein [Ruegeria atlantica]